MSKEKRPGNYITAVAKEFLGGDMGDRVVLFILTSIGLTIEGFTMFFSWQMSGVFLKAPWIVFLGILLVLLIGLGMCYGVWYFITDVWFDKAVTMEKVFKFHVTYMYVPVLIFICVTPFSEKTKYIDKKLDMQMEMTYQAPEGGKKW